MYPESPLDGIPTGRNPHWTESPPNLLQWGFRTLVPGIPTERNPHSSAHIAFTLTERSSNIKLCFYNKYNIEIGRYGEKRNDVIHRVCNTCSHNNDDAVSLVTKLTFFDPIFGKLGLETGVTKKPRCPDSTAEDSLAEDSTAELYLPKTLWLLRFN